MLHYILQTITFQLVFLLVYDLFLRRETFFKINRAYLIITPILSLVVPFIKLTSIKELVPEQFVIQLPAVIIGEAAKKESVIDVLINQPQMVQEPVFEWSWNTLLYLGMAIAGILLIVKFAKLFWMIHRNPKSWKGDLLVVELLNSNAAFSFFQYVFLGAQIKPENQPAILEHELVHVKEKHTLDLLFFELLRVAFWFNPLVYMYQGRISEIHEFLADAKASKLEGKKQYYQSLLSQIFDTQHFSFTNPFFKQSIIKKRIFMISKTKSSLLNVWKYALLIPMVFGMLMYTSSYSQDPNRAQETKVEASSENISDEALFKKYYQEIITLDNNGKSFKDIYSLYLSKSDSYIVSRDDYYKNLAFLRFVGAKRLKSPSDITLSEDDIKLFESLSEFKSYQDYLEFKKTKEAKLRWEKAVSRGTLGLFVEDMANLTEDEQKRYDEKMKMLKEDDYYHTLVMTDGKITSSFEYGTKNSKAQDPVDLDIEVPYAVIEEAPFYASCDTGLSNEERKACTAREISKYVNQNFNVDIAKEAGLTGQQRINVIFKIGKDGAVRDVLTRAHDSLLSGEAFRVVSSMPKFVPGKQKGKLVTVPYSLPIIFQVPENNENEIQGEAAEAEKSNPSLEIEVLNELPFAVVDQAPAFKGCEGLVDKDKIKQCTTDEVNKYVNTNFRTAIGKEQGLQGKQWANVIFKIGKDGKVYDVNARASHPALAEEAKRVVNTFPPFVPGQHNGRLINVAYSLPISFEVH
ncbi:M56 family metallopeptidase [Mangrovimonas xylaniphaga]|uniref:M56 family metallopeptidase n=1 Tax=Mangrovimonas xylaniphaga TaxID=1645915 RepID=UPI0006B486EE|nr:M56 family metallopeptidase [Mangrovimonas xylaniphaga]